MNGVPTEHDLLPGAIYREFIGRYLWWDAASKVFCAVEIGDPVSSPDLSHLVRVDEVAVYVPSPAEPSGLGAVVRDADAQVWTRFALVANTPNWNWSDGRRDRTWADMRKPVEVLSPGVEL